MESEDEMEYLIIIGIMVLTLTSFFICIAMCIVGARADRMMDELTKGDDEDGYEILDGGGR